MIILDGPESLAWLKEAVGRKGPMGSRYILLPDGISQQNFSYAALKIGVNFRDFNLSTLTEFAHTLLKVTGAGDYELLEERERDLARAFIRSVISTSTESELGFLRKLDIENKDTLKVVRQEFDDYLRATNDTEFHSDLEKIAQGLKDEFARSVALSYLSAFFALRSKLGTLTTEQFGDRVLLFRAQLLKIATAAVETTENKILFSGWEVAVAGIPVVDAAVLRMLVAVGSRDGCTLRVFCTPKLYENLRKRLDSIGIQYEDETGGKIDVDLIPPAKAIRGETTSGQPRFISAPDRRREILRLAEDISQLFTEGVHPSEILVVARDSGSYQTLASSILPAYGVPVHVQTRHLESLLPQTQMVASLLRLLTKVSGDDEIGWSELTDPIRLGVCLWGKKGWPMEGRHFVHVEEVLARIQTKEDRKLRLDEWIGKIPPSYMFQEPQRLVLEFLNWVKQSAGQPSSSANAVAILREVLSAYVYNRTGWVRETLDPRIEDPARFRLSDLHPTKHAERIRKSLRDLEEYFEAAQKAGIISSITWDRVLTAYTDVIVSSTFGVPVQDLGAVRFVDAGNTSFIDAKHLFLVGMRADDFPKKHEEGKLLGEELRRAMPNAGGGNSGYIYLPSPETDYDTDRDYLTTSLMAAKETITCSMAYLDESGHQVEWSPFVSHLTRDVTPMAPGDWLPKPITTWKDLVQKEPRWINWRLLSYHQFRRPVSGPGEEVKPEEISQMAVQVEPGFYNDRLRPRIKQYIEPDPTITVAANEQWYSALPLDAIAGPPYTTYELDIHATCPFQFYFYQFLYLRKFDAIDRLTIPYWYWKMPWVPIRLSRIYPSHETDTAIGKVVSLLPSRQKDLQALSTKSLGDLLSQNLSMYEARRVRSSFWAERSLVYQETSETPLPLKRDWEWIPGGNEVKIENANGESARIVLPPHRVDTLRSSILILTYVSSSWSLRSLVYRNELRAGQVIDRHIVDPIVDYRLASLISYYSSKPIAGALFVGLYGERRQGYYQRELIPEHKGKAPYSEELPMPLGQNPGSLQQVFSPEAWDRRVEDFRNAVIKRSAIMTPGSTVTYTAAPEQDKCRDCTYYSLCSIPRARGW